MSPQYLGIMIPIIAIVLGIGCAIVSIIAGHRQRMQRTELRYRERLAAIEKGLELPPDPPEFAIRPTLRGPRLLLRGLVLLFLGIVLTAALFQNGQTEYLFGLLPSAVGLAYLLYYLLEGRRTPDAAPAGSGPADASQP